VERKKGLTFFQGTTQGRDPSDCATRDDGLIIKGACTQSAHARIINQGSIVLARASGRQRCADMTGTYLRLEFHSFWVEPWENALGQGSIGESSLDKGLPYYILLCPAKCAWRSL